MSLTLTDRVAIRHPGIPAAGRPEISAEIRSYLENSYPNNHDYRVVNGKLVPRFKLCIRLRKLKPLYPRPLTSLLDLSCCKGYFVCQAALEPQCERVLGIDIHQPDLDASRAVRAHLGLDRVQIEKLELHELAERIDDFGGPFQTVLLINMYQYLFFGSSRSPHCYLSHDEILRHLQKVCSGRVIFNNRLEFDRLQDHCRQVAGQHGLQQEYSTARFLESAAKYFQVTPFGKVGRYPIWALDAR